MLSDYKAFVIGGLGGIGSCICKTLLSQNVSKLAIIDLRDDLPDSFKDLSNVIYYKCGIEEKSKLRDVFNDISKQFNGFNLAINTAGVSDETNYEKTFSINTVREL